MRRLLIVFACFCAAFLSYSHTAFAHEEVPPDDFGVREGDIVRAPSDPDVYIVNAHGYKRLLLNPTIFSFYRHLRWENVRFVNVAVFPVSLFFRNCEVNDPKIYALEPDAEDSASLHWMNMSASEALAQDHDFFDKTFCINAREFAWYPKGGDYRSFAEAPPYSRENLPPAGVNETAFPLAVPSGFKISLFTPQALGPLRFMAFSPDSILFVSLPASAGLYSPSRTDDGKIFALPDLDRNGKADETRTVLAGLHIPHGIAFYNNFLYIAEEHAISRYPYLGNAAVGSRQVVVSNLPTGGEHVSRTLHFGPNGKMYVSLGSSCNACVEQDERFAAVMEYNADGSGGRVYARGLRNSVGLAFNPLTGELWATDNGRDFLGDNLPPDEVNIIRAGAHYGWPYCYGKNAADGAFTTSSSFCPGAKPSTYDIQAHSAVLGLRFIASAQFPASWQGDLFVAYHGSWNRSVPTGYKVARLHVEGNFVQGEEDFLSGWLDPSGTKYGRPVDVIFDPTDGTLFISDDRANVIYRVSKI